MLLRAQQSKRLPAQFAAMMVRMPHPGPCRTLSARGTSFAKLPPQTHCVFHTQQGFLMKKIILGIAGISLVSHFAAAQTAPAPAAAPAAPTPAARGPALDLALEAAKVALDTCRGLDQKVGVSVVDSAGVLRVLLATDGAAARGVQNSTYKAQTALAFNAPTSLLAEQAKSDKAIADKLASNPNYLNRAGGILIKVGDEVIGAIGVGGARGSEKDEACAVAGLEKVKTRLQ